MTTDQPTDSIAGFLQTLTAAVSDLKDRLQDHYERVYPGLGNFVRLVIDDEEATAWDLSSLFPHLLLPDLVEARLAQLGLKPAETTHANIWAPWIDAQGALAAA